MGCSPSKRLVSFDDNTLPVSPIPGKEVVDCVHTVVIASCASTHNTTTNHAAESLSDTPVAFPIAHEIVLSAKDAQAFCATPSQTEVPTNQGALHTNHDLASKSFSNNILTEQYETEQLDTNASRMASEAASKATSMTPTPPSFHDCAHCGAGSARSLCGRCRGSHYCSKKCQRADWPQHKRNCKSV